MHKLIECQGNNWPIKTNMVNAKGRIKWWRLIDGFSFIDHIGNFLNQIILSNNISYNQESVITRLFVRL